MLLKDVIHRSFWALPKGEALTMLETSFNGLSEDEIAERQVLFGRNSLPKRSRLDAFRILLRQFESPLILLLLTTVVITTLLRDYKDAIFIGLAIVVNVVLGFYQENKAETAIADIQSYIRERARVFRDGREVEVDSENLVPGDIVHVSQGDRVPSDCRLIYINDLLVDESILTGESLPVLKTTEPSSFKAVIADQRSMIFKGTTVIQGFANALVCRTGKTTELGKIAALVATVEKERTPLQEAIIKFSVKASILLVALTVVIFFLGVTSGKSFLEMFLTSVAIAVAAVPEGLPVALTVILAIGVQRLAIRKGVVRKLLAAETLGSTSVILTDKTGTLTEAKMSLASILCFAPNCDREKLVRYAIINSDVVIENPSDHSDKWRIIGRPLEVALVKSAADTEIYLPKVKKESKVIDYLPFNSSNKFSSSVLENESGLLLNVFGAPEILLKYTDLPHEERRRLNYEINTLAKSGGRVVAIATKIFPLGAEIILRDKKTYAGLEFQGIISFHDPIRPHVRDVIETVKQAGIKVIIVTGDHQGTAEAVAKQVGLFAEADQIIDGADLDALSDDELKIKLPNIKIFSRVSPEGKLRILRAFKSLGETVAMTGDGLNDAATLKEADIGIAMGSGTDVAKDVSDLVILDNDFSTIAAAMEEGRRILENIRKVIVYLVSSIFDELILIGGSIIVGLVLPMNALQILFVNFVTDSVPAIGLAFEDHIDSLTEKRRPIGINLFDKEMKFLTLVIGIPTSLFLFFLYWLLIELNFDSEIVRTFIFASFSTYTLFLVLSVRSLRRPIFSYNPFSNLYLLSGIIFGFTATALAIYWTPFQKLFNTVTLPPVWLFGIIGVGIFNVAMIELGKFVLRKRNGKNRL